MNRHFYKTIVAAACALLLIAACNDSYTPRNQRIKACTKLASRH